MRDAYVRLVGNKGVEISGSSEELLEIMAAIMETIETRAYHKAHNKKMQTEDERNATV